MSTPADPTDLLAEKVALRVAELLGPRLAAAPAAPAGPPTMTPAAVAAAIGVNRTVATTLMRTGRVKAVNVGRGRLEHLRSWPEAVAAFLAARPAPAG